MAKWLETKQQREDFLIGFWAIVGLLAFWTLLVTFVWGINQSHPKKWHSWMNDHSYLQAYGVMSLWAVGIIVGIIIVIGVICGVVWLCTAWVNSGADKAKSEVEADIVREAVNRT